jgi:hypothetical protein
MAENPIVDRRDGLADTGVRPGESMGSPSGRGGRFESDLKPLKELDTALVSLNKNIDKLKTDLPKVITLTDQWAKNMTKVATAMSGMGAGRTPGGGGGSKGYLPDAGTLTQQNLGGPGGPGGLIFGNVTYNVDRSQTANVLAGGGKGAAAATANDIAKQIGDSLMNALNKRIGENAQYSLSASRMDMLYQQTTGMGGQEVRDRMRAPLSQYKLGTGGINSVMALQASTGIDASKQGRSAEFIRVASGYGYSTDQANQMARGLADPNAANRMFMTMGTGLYKVGGEQRSTKEVIQASVQRLGLTTQSAVDGAMAPGSMTRERMRQSGLPEDMQDIALQYAKENIAFKKKGGVGMYDASDKTHRKFVGVEDSYANQNAETERLKNARDESMYNKQADSYATMEKGMQSVVKVLQKFEESLADIIGLKIKAKPASGVGGFLGKIAPALGLIPGPWGKAASVAATLASSFLGDPTGERDSGTVSKASASTGATSGTSAKGDGGNIARSKGALDKIHPRMRTRIEAMMKENPKLYIGGGTRSTAQQKEMFMSRYEPTDQKTDVFWKGQYWKRVRGAAAAPPGMSMHEIGLAVDLAPSTEFDWIKENAARFGLRSFFDVNNEPWHVQPSELPGSRMQYEKMGAPWGHNGNVVEPTDTNAKIPDLEKLMHQSVSGMGGAAGKGANMNIANYAGLSMDAAIRAMGLNMNNSSGGSGSPSGNYVVSTSGTTNPISPGSNSSGRNVLKGAQVARYMYMAGFRGKDLVDTVAIAGRESSFDAKALGDGNTSYGLMQIHMKGNLGVDRRRQFNIANNEQLFDPATNARASWITSGGGTNFKPWAKKKWGWNHLTATNVPAAEKFVKQAGYATTGDPIMDMSSTAPSRGSGSVVVQGDSGNTFHVSIAPTINLNGGNNYGADVQRLSNEVSSLLEREVKLLMLRST